MEKITIFEAFSGYGSQSLALERLKKDTGLEYEVVGYSEIDKNAIIAYDALHPDVKNYGDVTAIDWSTVPDFDILTWSSPCTNISAAGKMEGMDEDSGTQSSFIWCIKDCLAVKKPKYILVENVANIVGKRFIGQFNRFQQLLESFGYKCFCKKLNATEFNVPQNRLRLFLVAVREGLPTYHFPEPIPMERRLKDCLEDEVDEKYYLSPERVLGMIKSTQKESGRGNGFAFVPKDAERDDIANTVCAGTSTRKTDNFIAEPVVMQVGQLYDQKTNPQAGRVYDPEGVSPTLDTMQGGNREPKIITRHHGYNRGNIVSDVAPTVKASAYVDNNYVVCGAIRGRSYKGEPQHLEENSAEHSNTITTVAKDNVIVERTVLGWVRDKEGNVIKQPEVDVANCVTAGKRDNTQNYVKEVSILEDFYATVRDPREYGEYSPTLRSERAGLMVKEQILLNGDKDGNASTLTTGHHYEGNITNPKGGHKQMGVLEYDGVAVRIRRLTEREIFRLMDVSEPDIDILLNCGVPRSQLQKMAGNSIVVNVLYHLFRKMLVDKENESQQTFLF